MMSHYDSALATPAMQELACTFLSRVVNAPAYAADLVLRAGKISRNA